MFRNISVLAIFCASFLATGPAATALPWPPTSSGTDIGGGLPSGYEPSGIVWDNFTGALWLVHDEGQLSRMLRDGTFTETWDIYLPGTNPPQKPDLESIAVTGTSPKVYLGVEDPPTILEYNSSSTAAPWASGKSWELDLPTVAGSGMEGLTWVPNGYHPYANSASGGLFYASGQSDGRVYVYDVNLSQTGTAPLAPLGWFTPLAGQNDISDLYFSSDTRTLFVLYDFANQLLEVDTSTKSYPVMSTYVLPTYTTGQEGVTLLPQCPGAKTDIYIADDTNGASHVVYRLNNFPQLCTAALAPTADATTRQASPNSNYGLTANLTKDSAVNADENFLARFNLSGITLSQIARAQLVFFATDGTDQSPQYCATAANWAETTITWNNQPPCSGNNTGGGVAVDNNNWVSYDVRSPLQSGWSSFRFTPRSTNDLIASSRQASGNRPKLILWLTGQ